LQKKRRVLKFTRFTVAKVQILTHASAALLPNTDAYASIEQQILTHAFAALLLLVHKYKY
jgi:hypothetical protein